MRLVINRRMRPTVREAVARKAAKDPAVRLGFRAWVAQVRFSRQLRLPNL